MSMFTDRSIFDQDHDDFRASVRGFLHAEAEPNLDTWRSAGAVSPEFFLAAGEQGMLATGAPVEFGGGGVDDPRFVAVLVEEAAASGSVGLAHLIALHSGVTLPLLLRHGGPEAIGAWVPAMAQGRCPVVPLGVGQPLSADPADGRVALYGRVAGVAGGALAKAFLTGVTLGGEQRLTVVAADTDGLSATWVPEVLGGRESGEADLGLDAVAVDSAGFLAPGAWADLVGDLDLWSAVISAAAARSVLGLTLAYVAERTVFGRPLAQFENTRYRLAEIAARLAATGRFVDSCLLARCENRLRAADAAAARLEAALLHDEIVDRGLQLHGGYGYMSEYPIAHAFADARYLRQQEHAVHIAHDVIAADLGL